MGNRVAFHANESYYADLGYFIAKITEDEAGYRRTSFGIYTDVADAKAFAADLNAKMGHTPDDVLDIVASSMRLGKVNK